MKIPPRAMFWAQVIATIIAGTVQLGVQQWMFSNIPDMCQKGQSSGFICPSTETFYTASVVWGVIGPARQFSQGQIYYGELYTARPGCYVSVTQFYEQVWCSSSSAVLSVRQLCTSIPGNTPIAPSEISSMTQLHTMCLYRADPGYSFPVIFSGTAAIPPATAVNYVPWAIIGFIFQFVIRRRHFSWWAKYNYVLSAALDAGVAIGALFVFFA